LVWHGYVKASQDRSNPFATPPVDDRYTGEHFTNGASGSVKESDAKLHGQSRAVDQLTQLAFSLSQRRADLFSYGA